MIVHTDCKNEADDQFALAHHLLTPKFIVKGVVAGHFDLGGKMYKSGRSASASLQEVQKVLELMDATEVPAFLGAQVPLNDEHTPIDSEGARFIIEEAMRDDPHPLFIACQGAVTDLASALLMKPEIATRLTAVWIGGGAYPKGGFEFNVQQDIAAANVLMKSEMPIWQIPSNVYRQMSVSLSELQLNVEPCGAIGKYLFEQMLEVNEDAADIPYWPNGETWGLGDSPTIGVFLEDPNNPDLFDEIAAPSISYEDMSYCFNNPGRKIRVFHTINPRLILDDMFAKLKINFL
jgi:inosine-uridine nucleoside N-ribohydrolase